MKRLVLLGVAALLSAAAAVPATAQEVISNPGYCAQFYPNANCQNKGPNNPYTGDYQLRREIRGRLRVVGRPLRHGRRVLRRPRRPPLRLPLRRRLTVGRSTPSASRPAVYSLAMPISLITRAYLAS